MPSPKPAQPVAPAMAFFETSVERVTRFVGGHWGTMTAFAGLVIGLTVFVTQNDTPIAGFFENFITLISVVLLFLLQRAQAKDTLTLQLKLNELISSLDNANSEMINIENLREEQVRELSDQFKNMDTTAPASTQQQNQPMR